MHLYGEGADPESDPDGKVDSPLEALEKRKAAGYRHVIDIPYEFDANSRDTLVVLREGYGRHAPDWDANLESRFQCNGLDVKLASSSGGDHHKISARETTIEDALRGRVEPLGRTRHPATPPCSSTTTTSTRPRSRSPAPPP